MFYFFRVYFKCKLFKEKILNSNLLKYESVFNKQLMHDCECVSAGYNTNGIKVLPSAQSLLSALDTMFFYPSVVACPNAQTQNHALKDLQKRVVCTWNSLPERMRNKPTVVMSSHHGLVFPKNAWHALCAYVLQ